MPTRIGTRPGTLLALDTSSRACGWAVFVDGVLIRYGKWVLDATHPHGERMYSLHMSLSQTLAEFNPDLVVYEAPYHGRMRNAYAILSKYVSTVELTYRMWSGAPLPPEAAVAASSIKKLIGAPKGSSHGDNKREVVNLVNSHFGLRLKFNATDRTKQRSDDDVADAIAVGWAFLLSTAEEAAPIVTRKRVAKRRSGTASLEPPRRRIKGCR